MPLTNLPFTGEKDPLKKAQNVYKTLEESSIDAIFVSEKNTKKEVTRAYIEMVIEDFAMMTQNQALFNKFLQIDTKVEKSLREYQAELKGLINGIIGTSMVQPQQPLQMQQPTSMPTQPQPDTQVMPQTMTSEPPKSVGIE
jgi:hypothetical protein